MRKKRSDLCSINLYTLFRWDMKSQRCTLAATFM